MISCRLCSKIKVKMSNMYNLSLSWAGQVILASSICISPHNRKHSHSPSTAVSLSLYSSTAVFSPSPPGIKSPSPFTALVPSYFTRLHPSRTLASLTNSTVGK